MDLFLYYISLYNTVFKILFISLTSYIIFLTKIKKPYSLGYDAKSDSFNHYVLIYIPALILTVIFHISSN